MLCLIAVSLWIVRSFLASTYATPFPPVCMAWSPDGQRLAAGDPRHMLELVEWPASPEAMK
ncbi:MAG: hypothetical protein ACAI35_04010 [Candidatus Methylacidiphilales bacterium]|nr:hypothetical protein [Candidatus Methylacidiphilales bacterium]